MYVLPYDSKADLLALRTQCRLHDLPDPLEPLEIDGALLPRHVFIHDGPRVFPYFVPNQESVKLFHDYLDLHRNNPDLDVQMVPVSVMFGRAPGREVQGEQTPHLRELNGVQKFLPSSGWDATALFASRQWYRCAAWPPNTAPIKPSRKSSRAWRASISPVSAGRSRPASAGASRSV